jgi:hypothetical protein
VADLSGCHWRSRTIARISYLSWQEWQDCRDQRIAIAMRREIDVWWVQLIGGIITLALGFWAAGYYGRSAVLLVAWIAAWAIIRGVRDIILAFRVREAPGDGLRRRHQGRVSWSGPLRARASPRRMRTRTSWAL